MVTRTGYFRLRIDEVAELGLPLGITAGNAHDVAGIRGREVGILVDQCLAHPGRVFGIDAKHDGFLEPVAAFLQEGRDLLRHQLGPVVNHQRAVEILDIVNAVLDKRALPVELAFLRAVAFDVAVDMDPDHLVGRQEAVADALFERVGEHRLAEIVDVGDVFRLFRRGGEADLGCRAEIFENFAPGRIFGGAAAMAFVDHDKVEKAGRKLAEEFLPLLRPGDRLVEAEIDFVSGIDAALPVECKRYFRRAAVLAVDGSGVGRELCHRPAERAEIVDHRLVDEDVAVGQEQDALLASGLPQSPDDLEGGVGLAGAGRHHEQDAVLPLGDGFDRGVNGADLVIARALVAAVVVVVLENDFLRFGRQALPTAIARPQFAGRRKGVEPEVRFG